jgi:hypothetical protein
MAGSKSNYLENANLLWALGGGTAPTRPTSWSLALYKDAAGLSGDQPSQEVTTTDCPGYARQTISAFTVSGSGGQNTADVPDFVATGTWATINYWAILDQLGDILYWGTVNAPTGKTLANTEHLRFAAGQLSCTED